MTEKNNSSGKAVGMARKFTFLQPTPYVFSAQVPVLALQLLHPNVYQISSGIKTPATNSASGFQGKWFGLHNLEFLATNLVGQSLTSLPN